MTKPATGATPLFAMHAMALDTETTGLDPATARLVQLGMTPIDNGRIDPALGWEKIVNPGMEIPEKSVEVHGITNSDAAAAPALAGLWPEFTRQLEGRVIIGHTIGFDLAVLASEARRCGLEWKRPRALCVRMLAMLVAPALANHSLDALASWLGVEIENRHQALGDAEAAGRVFLALVPLLQEAGIETLAQAERACMRLTPEVERHQSAGWQMPVDRTGQATPRSVLGGSDSFAYRLSVGEVMSSPPVIVPSDNTLKQAMDLMTKSGISSVFVADDPASGQPVDAYGIVTERDVMRRISALGEKAFALPLAEIATRPLGSIRESAFVYRAMGRMARLKYRHLAVRDEEGNLTGIVSARDLLKVRAGPAIVLDDTIEVARTAKDLAAAWSTLPAVISALLAEDVDSRTNCRIISEEIRSMTRRSAILAQERMEAGGNGPPPCAFAVLVLGSGGRGESMLVPDQDNAIIFDDGEPDGPQDRWFAEMATHMADILDQSGIPYCNGGVMAKNPQWRGSRALWHARIDEWVSRSNPQDLLNVDIFFDLMPVHGEMRLGHALFRSAYETGSQSTSFAKLLGESLASVPDPFSMFGALRPAGNRLDLKKHILFPVSALARTLTIRHNLAHHSTRERIEALLALDIGSDNDLRGLLDAHHLALTLVLDNQARDIEAGLKPSNFIDLAKLTREWRDDLKQALRQVQVVPEVARELMFQKR